ncbi:hypothetical protein ACN08P_15780 (plasmid) [Photobacterium leiognathi subsp. mandapamensis]|uniref:hypothetical protein n=1 Tax=Photobacterium leiognathi TaxID=553611 RepID=UPI003AF3CDC1
MSWNVIEVEIDPRLGVVVLNHFVRDSRISGSAIGHWTSTSTQGQCVLRTTAVQNTRTDRTDSVPGSIALARDQGTAMRWFGSCQ